ncbi:MAG TPA: Mur ligase family protein, partial [Thermoanaerobaculia bacterium]
MGRPERAFASVLVGGTNGKGSTAAALAALAGAAGRRVGLYTSPHLIRATERVRVDGGDVLPDALDGALARVFEEADRAPQLPLTYFEAITAAAFLLFRDAEIDLAVVEVGLGGRLDATNVVPASLSVVTSIAMDHMADLGDSLPAIAREKAGIFRRGRPALVRAVDPAAFAVLAAEAGRIGAELHDARAEIRIRSVSVGFDGTDFELETPSLRARLRTPLPGAHQAWNAALAVRAAELLPDELGALSPETVAAGFSRVRWAGRLERAASPRGRPVLLDGCHNPEGARALADFLDD